MKTNLPKISTPVYRDVLPSNNEEFTYRPFLVREEKILQLIKNDENVQIIYDSLNQLISNCTDLDPEKLSTFDIEYIFLRLREKSIGEIIPLRMPHLEKDSECSHVEKTFMDLREIKVFKNESHSSTIEIDSERNLKLKMRYPKYDNILKLQKNQDFDTILKVLINCTEMILDGTETYETKNFTEDELKEFYLQFNMKHIEKVKSFFDDMPKICYDLKWKCSKCGKDQEHRIEGVQNFLS